MAARRDLGSAGRALWARYSCFRNHATLLWRAVLDARIAIFPHAFSFRNPHEKIRRGYASFSRSQSLSPPFNERRPRPWCSYPPFYTMTKIRSEILSKSSETLLHSVAHYRPPRPRAQAPSPQKQTPKYMSATPQRRYMVVSYDRSPPSRPLSPQKRIAANGARNGAASTSPPSASAVTASLVACGYFRNHAHVSVTFHFGRTTPISSHDSRRCRFRNPPQISEKSHISVAQYILSTRS